MKSSLLGTFKLKQNPTKASQRPENHDTPDLNLALKKKPYRYTNVRISRNTSKVPRRTKRAYPASSLFVFITMALLADRVPLTSIQRDETLLTERQFVCLECPDHRGLQNRPT